MVTRRGLAGHLLSLILVLLASRTPAEVHPHQQGYPPYFGDKDSQGIFVLDGSAVHNVGELQLNITNWGLIGSRPSQDSPYSVAPSAMWPAGSGIDHLFAAGLWIGGIRGGVPLVTTGQYTNELLPSAHPLDRIYEMSEGEAGGSRFPYPNEDDDGDGRLHEDPKDGFDNDGDGLIDEDFVALATQHFRCTMRDDTVLSQEMWPDHDPLGIEVIQESFQWDNPRLEDSVGFEFTIRNVSRQIIEDVYVGFFADGDIGRRSATNVSQDDMVGLYTGLEDDSQGLGTSIAFAYMYDCDGDKGQAPGYIGFSFLGSGMGFSRPYIPTFRYFTGTRAYGDGGDPTNDNERYEVLSRPGIQRLPEPCEDANDYRILMAFQPSGGYRFPPGAEIHFRMAISVGEGLHGLKKNMADITSAYYGRWFDRDGDPETGVRGRESYICESHFGPPGTGNPIYDMFQDCYGEGGSSPIRNRDLDENGCIWANRDCSFEQSRGVFAWLCWGIEDGYYTEPSGCTGVLGKEYPVRWIAEAPPLTPRMRTWDTHNSVHVFWDSRTEEEIHPEHHLPIFESYRVWRADDWDRPLGSSIEAGPGTIHWIMLDEYDLVDEFMNAQGGVREWLPFGNNTGLAPVAYTPKVLRPFSPEWETYQPLADLIDRIVAENPDLSPDRPLRFVDAQGNITPLGERYPELSQWGCCVDQVDTLAWDRLGRTFYEYIDREVHNGFYYFYSVTVATIQYLRVDGELLPVGIGPSGQPRANYRFSIPQSPAQSAEERASEGPNIYVVPNPATREALDEFSRLEPNQDDPTGVRVEFRNLPKARNTVRVFTLSGDLVATLHHDGSDGAGSLSWNLVSKNGQQVVSGIYLYSVESNDRAFDRYVGRFVIVQ